MCVLTLKNSHRPVGKVADVLAPAHACTTANASVNYKGGECRDFTKFPLPGYDFHMFLRMFACRAAVSTSNPALSQSSTPKCIPIKLPMCVFMLKISHRPHAGETHVLLDVCREAVSGSIMAQ